MEHVLFCGTRLRVLIILTIAAAFFAFPGSAFALFTTAVPPTGTITKDPATVDQFDGSVTGGVGHPDDCLNPVDPNDPFDPNILFTCSIHQLDPVDSGPVEVVVSWVPVVINGVAQEPNIALAVYECLDPKDMLPNEVCTLIKISNRSADPTIAFERVTFDARGDDQEATAVITYQIRVAPLFVFAAQPYHGCAGYTQTSAGTPADPCPNPITPEEQPPIPPTKEQFLTCTAGATGDRRMQGSGEVDNTDKTQINVFRRDDKGLKGKINHRYAPTKRKFGSRALACATWDDTNKQVTVKGTGWVWFDGNGNQAKQNVCFVARYQDKGYRKGGMSGDNFDLTTVPLITDANGTQRCDTLTPGGTEMHGGVLTKGDFRFTYERAKDCEYENN